MTISDDGKTTSDLSDFSPCRKITIIPETGVRIASLKDSYFPNSCKYFNIHKNKCDFLVPYFLNYTVYYKQVTTFSTCLTETSIK